MQRRSNLLPPSFPGTIKPELFQATVKVNRRNYIRMLYGNRQPSHRNYDLGAGNPGMLKSAYALLSGAGEYRISKQLENKEISEEVFARRKARLNQWFHYKVNTRQEEFTLAALEGKIWLCPP